MGVKHELKYGFWMAVVLFAWLLAEYVSGIHSEYMHLQPFSTMASMLVLVVGTYHCIKDKNEVSFDSKGSFDQLIIPAGLVILATSVLTYAFSFIYYNFINSEFTEHAVSKSIELLLEKHPDISAEVIENERINQMVVKSPGTLAMDSFSRVIIFGLFIMLSVVGVIVFQNKKR
ncbi:MAG: DUF4199 domain-containing protein [Bacteroidetes bacterium]|nr:DUF4199 domain-containing protein [Bacteroidota bacterium]